MLNRLNLLKRFFLLVHLLVLFAAAKGQICATPGLDGPENISNAINTYYPVEGNLTLSVGSTSLPLSAVPRMDQYGNSFGTNAIFAGDLLLIIQMQDASINFNDDASYGSNNPAAGADGLGGTGFTDLGNTGRFEYVVATNSVSLAGGNLVFRGAAANSGTVFTYANSEATFTEGKKSFQIVRVPQYSNLVLKSDISTPPFNGKVGGIIAFDVAGTIDFNGFTVDASARGFRGGYGPKADSGPNTNSIYAIPSSTELSSGKGEGIAGTPRFMWDGYNQVDNGFEGLPGGSYGKGAPGNAGGGGNDHNSGGGGGGNGGEGGVGGIGYEPLGGTLPNGGRPGSITYTGTEPDITRLIMGGGGGGGDANNTQGNDAVKGGVGGGIVLINVATVTGTGLIKANGSQGEIGVVGTNPDGAGGGGAGGTVFIKVTNPDPTAYLKIEAKGGDGGNTEQDPGGEAHGPGGGGGGGLIFYTVATGTVDADAGEGRPGVTDSGNGTPHGALNGLPGKVVPYDNSTLPPYLQGGGFACYPGLTTTVYRLNSTIAPVLQGSSIEYVVETVNAYGGGNAGGVQVQIRLPQGLRFQSFTLNSTGTRSRTGDLFTDANGLVTLGNFNISPGDTIKVILAAEVTCETEPTTHNASAQAVYLDPSRTIIDPQRRITAATNAFPGTNPAYQNPAPGPVLGSNYNGTLPSATAEDVIVGATPLITNNIINSTLPGTICDSIDVPIIIGSEALGGNGINYQWQKSNDGINFTDILSVTGVNYDPSLINRTTYYRRRATSVCVPEVLSNPIVVSVFYSPKADFETPEVCLADQGANFTNKSLNADSTETGLSYLWDFGDANANDQRPNTSTERNPTHRYTQAAVYTSKLIITSPEGCIDSISKQFTVNGSTPKAGFEVVNSETLCSNYSVGFRDTASVDFGEITKIDWYFDLDNNPGQKETDENPVIRAAGDSIYRHNYGVFTSQATKQFRVGMVVYSGGVCLDSITRLITIHAVPEVQFDSIPPVCFSSTRVLLTQAKEIHNVVVGSWAYSGTGVNAQGLFDPAVAGVGIHEITYVFSSGFGCADTAGRMIVVYESPQVEGKDVSVLEGGQIILPATVTGDSLAYKWTPSAALSADDVLNPTASPTNDTRYTLIVTNKNDCSDTTFVNVKVFRIPRVPNTFTPNGDGINDAWVIEHLETYPNATVQIFNRYGKTVIPVQKYVPWNGKGAAGEELSVGVYYYIINPGNGRGILTGYVTILK